VLLVAVIATVVPLLLRNGPDKIVATVNYDMIHTTIWFLALTKPWPPTKEGNPWLDSTPNLPVPSPQVCAFQYMICKPVDAWKTGPMPKSNANKKFDPEEIVVHRNNYKTRMESFFGAHFVPHSRTSLGGVDALWFVYPGVDNSTSAPTAIYAHGGGACFGTPAFSSLFLYEFSRASGMRVLSVDFPLAPENPLPAGPQAVVDVYQHVIHNLKVKPEQIIIMGESGGGFVALHSALLIKKQKIPNPAGFFISSPMVDASLQLPSHKNNNGRDMFNTEDLALAYHGLCPKRNFVDPECNPLYANFSGLPPLFFQASSTELLVDDSVKAAEIAKKAGVQVELEIVPHVPHAIAAFAAFIPEGREATGRAAAWTKKVRQ